MAILRLLSRRPRPIFRRLLSIRRVCFRTIAVLMLVAVLQLKHPSRAVRPQAQVVVVVLLGTPSPPRIAAAGRSCSSGQQGSSRQQAWGLPASVMSEQHGSGSAAASASAASGTRSGAREVRIIEIFENQRRLTAFHKKYSGADLLPIDPGCFSDEKGKDRYLEIDLVPLPENPTTHSNGSNGSNGSGGSNGRRKVAVGGCVARRSRGRR